MKHDPSQQYLPPPRFQPRREIVLMWREYYQKTHDGKLPSYGWLAMKSGVYRSTVIRILQAEGCCTEKTSGAFCTTYVPTADTDRHNPC